MTRSIPAGGGGLRPPTGGGRRPQHSVVVYEAALIVENGLHEGMDALIVVDAPVEARLDRIVARDGLTREEALNRLRAQVSDAARRAAATHVVDNSGTLEDTRTQVERLWRQIASSS
jgi:dephospho-CoA kinase